MADLRGKAQFAAVNAGEKSYFMRLFVCLFRVAERDLHNCGV